jgi:AcrR family transcriptional regulator
MPTPRKSTDATRERLLRAAERCFTDYGYEGSSLRRITRLAGANLAAVNYHFSSKRELWLEIMQRRLAPLNAERVRLIEELRRRTPPGKPLPVDQVCQAMLLPLERAFESRHCSSVAMARMVGRAFNEPHALRKELNRRTLDQFWRIFHTAVRDALPDLPAAEVDWKFYFLMSSMLGALAWQGRQPGMDHPMPDASFDAMLQRLSAFIAGGMRASVALPGKAKSAAKF